MYIYMCVFNGPCGTRCVLYVGWTFFLKGNKSVPILRHSLCADYVEHCREALKTYGSLVIGKLATSGHLHMWIRSLKEAEAGIFRVWVSFRLLDSVLRTQCRSGRSSHQEVSKLLVFLPNRTLPPLLHARLAVARRLGTCWLERWKWPTIHTIQSLSDYDSFFWLWVKTKIP